MITQPFLARRRGELLNQLTSEGFPRAQAVCILACIESITQEEIEKAERSFHRELDLLSNDVRK